MNSKQLACVGEHLLKCSYFKFLGVFPRDEVPKVTSYPTCLIANTDTSEEPGTHWIAISYISPYETEFFDSAALPPEFYGFTLPYVNTSTYRIQSLTSNVCGQFCLFYIFYRSHGYSLSSIISMFSSSDHMWNDSQVRKFYNKAKRASPICYTCACSCNQFCIQCCSYV